MTQPQQPKSGSTITADAGKLIYGEKSPKVLKERRREHVHISCVFSMLIKGPWDLFMKILRLNLPPFV